MTNINFNKLFGENLQIQKIEKIIPVSYGYNNIVYKKLQNK